MKKGKSIVAILCIYAFVFGMGTYAAAAENAGGEEANIESARQLLVRNGWTREQIEDLLTDEALLEYVDATLVGSAEKYYRVSETGAVEISEATCQTEVQQAKIEIAQQLLLNNSEISPQVKNELETDDGYMTFYVEVYASSVADVYVLNARYEWLIEPDDRETDVFGLGHSSQLTRTNDSVYSIYKADVKKTIGGSVIESRTYEDAGTLARGSGGVAVVFELYEDTYAYQMTERATNHRGFMQYKAEVNDSTVTRASAHAEYFHQDAVIAVVPTVQFPLGVGLTVSQENKFEAMLPNPAVSFSV